MAHTLYQGVTTPAASVTVYWAGTTTKPTIYNGPTGVGTALSNPMTADDHGVYAFWVDDGHYKITNGTVSAGVAADLTDVRIEYPESAISAQKINMMPFLGVAAQTLESWYEGAIAGPISTAGQITSTATTDATTVATGAITTPGGGSFGKSVFLGGNENIVSANGAQYITGQISELITLSTSGTTTDSTANLLPANSIIDAVTATVQTTITTATDWKLGDPTSAGRFSAVNATMTAGSSSVGLLHMAGDVATVALGPTQAAAAKVRITTTGTPGAGKIRVTVFYRQFVAPTS